MLKKRILTYHCLRLDVSVYRKDTIFTDNLRLNKRYYNHCPVPMQQKYTK